MNEKTLAPSWSSDVGYWANSSGVNRRPGEGIIVPEGIPVVPYILLAPTVWTGVYLILSYESE